MGKLNPPTLGNAGREVYLAQFGNTATLDIVDTEDLAENSVTVVDTDFDASLTPSATPATYFLIESVTLSDATSDFVELAMSFTGAFFTFKNNFIVFKVERVENAVTAIVWESTLINSTADNVVPGISYVVRDSGITGSLGDVVYNLYYKRQSGTADTLNDTISNIYLKVQQFKR